MRTIDLMRCVSHLPNLVIFCPTHPTPFFPTPHWSRWTLDMITPIHFLNPAATEACFSVGFEPLSRVLVSSELLMATDVQVFRAREIRVRRGTTIETRFKPACWTSKMRRLSCKERKRTLQGCEYLRFQPLVLPSNCGWCTT